MFWLGKWRRSQRNGKLNIIRRLQQEAGWNTMKVWNRAGRMQREGWSGIELRDAQVVESPRLRLAWKGKVMRAKRKGRSWLLVGDSRPTDRIKEFRRQKG